MKKIKLIAFLVCIYTITSAQNITKMEYWIDTDPGFGSGIDINGFSQAAFVVNFPNQIPASIQPGVHTIGFRSKDSNNVWSHCNFFSVLVNDTTTPGFIESLEFFWDIDSGKAYFVPFTPTSFVSDLSNEIFNVTVPINLSVGDHILYARSKDSHGKWSHTNYLQNVTIDSLGTELSELNQFGLSVYPNPFADNLTISTRESSKTRVILYNQNAQVVSDKIIYETTSIDTRYLAPGIYTILLWSEKNKIFRGCLVKSN
jgi:hypothetical protein